MQLQIFYFYDHILSNMPCTIQKLIQTHHNVHYLQYVGFKGHLSLRHWSASVTLFKSTTSSWPNVRYSPNGSTSKCDVIGRSHAGDAGSTRQSASFAPPEDTIFKVITAHLSPSRWLILYTAVRAPRPVHRALRCYLDSRCWVRLPSCLFAQGSDMTTEEEIGNITDYLTDSFHRLDLRLELSQSAIREK